MAAVSRDVKPQPQVEKKAPTSKKAAKDASQKASANGGSPNTFEAYERLLNSIPQFAGFGKLFKVLRSYTFFQLGPCGCTVVVFRTLWLQIT